MSILGEYLQRVKAERDEAVKLLKMEVDEREICSYAEDQGMETLMDMIDAAMEQSHE